MWVDINRHPLAALVVYPMALILLYCIVTAVKEFVGDYTHGLT